MEETRRLGRRLGKMQKWVFLILLVTRNFGMATVSSEYVQEWKDEIARNGLYGKRGHRKDPRTDEKQAQGGNAETSEDGEMCFAS